MVTTARIRMSASADSSGSHRYGRTLAEVIEGESDDHLTRAALWDTAELLRATLPDEMAMVELRHIEVAPYNEIGDLIGDGSAGWRLGHGCVIRRNAYPPLLVNPSGSCWPSEVQPTPRRNSNEKGVSIPQTPCHNKQKRQCLSLRLSALQALPRQVGWPDLRGACPAWYGWG